MKISKNTKMKNTKIKKKINKPVKALVLFSGGLDSRLVVKMLQDQKIKVETIYFKLPFGGGCCNNFSCVFNFNQISGVKLNVIDCTKGKHFQDYLELVKNPKHGVGTAMNPCKDCKVFMFKYAKTFAKKIKADIIATGEVLSQRPMSQLKQALLFDEKKAGLTNQILRPLSAKILPKTIYEEKGLVNTSNFLGLQGRQRKVQIKLAEKYKIKYPMPGGGCLLCEKDYCKKLKDLLNSKELKNIVYEDILLLEGFRHFRSKKTKKKIILGKNKEENDLLEVLNKKLKWNIIKAGKKKQPSALYNRGDKKLAEDLIIAYASKDLKLRAKFDKIAIK
jgi:tRNA U34 2-thiouridine synthase MnmA/TrmU